MALHETPSRLGWHTLIVAVPGLVLVIASYMVGFARGRTTLSDLQDSLAAQEDETRTSRSGMIAAQGAALCASKREAVLRTLLCGLDVDFYIHPKLYVLQSEWMPGSLHCVSGTELVTVSREEFIRKFGGKRDRPKVAVLTCKVTNDSKTGQKVFEVSIDMRDIASNAANPRQHERGFSCKFPVRGHIVDVEGWDGCMSLWNE
jgi:hypothetical protein